MRSHLFLPLLLLAACPEKPAGGSDGVVCEDPASSIYGLSDSECATLIDDDGDGFPIANAVFACCCNSCGTDCNDDDPDVHPADDNGDGPVDEANDGVDQDCDGVD